ncbi:portal protein [Serratia phage vB_SmaM_Hera]|uniref:Portal protein n=1 Tax=Serratia phage vB_SmaM_Hera TaxID=2777369 RepID=A0A7T3N975_9CAUD|nr:portal protein [Serratia phage vB_SmaM_Hera]
MGHYDEQREEEAAQSRRDTLERQARCNHSWQILSVNEYAEPIELCCMKCRAIIGVKKRSQ